jgi:hypothetical protein
MRPTQNEAYIAALYDLEQRKGKRSKEERELADLLRHDATPSRIPAKLTS